MNEAAEARPSMWSAGSTTERAVVDEDCGPTKTCRNMRHVSFDGLAEPGSDLRAAWRERLASEGKLGAGSLADLILGER
jgi:hypothetical protein